MSDFSKHERVLAALSGQEVDRVPVSAWGHIIPAEKDVQALAEATLHFASEYDWDWIKVNPRATYFAEAWGNQYDFDDYAGVLPKLRYSPLGEKPDLEAIKPVSATGGAFGDHLKLLQIIKKGIQDTPFVQTVFTPISVLGFLVGRTSASTQEAITNAQYAAVKKAIQKEPQVVHKALEAITETLINYATEVLNAGADGIYLAITGFARKGVLTRAEYQEFGKPYDLKILNAVQESRFNIFHICGPEAYLEAVADLPVPALSWAAAPANHNPNLSEARSILDKAFIGGVDEKELLLKGHPEEVAAQAKEALALGGKTKFLLAPGCSIDPSTPHANLWALRQSVNSVPTRDV